MTKLVRISSEAGDRLREMCNEDGMKQEPFLDNLIFMEHSKRVVMTNRRGAVRIDPEFERTAEKTTACK
jgi:hypothetical protein